MSGAWIERRADRSHIRWWSVLLAGTFRTLGPRCYGEKVRLVCERVLGRHDEGISMTFSETPIERIAVAVLPESVGPAAHVAGPCLAETDPLEPRQ
jgi:hypothetical protein